MTNQNNSAQAANKEICEAFELTYAVDAADPACAADLFHFTNGWRALLSKLRAPVAGEAQRPLGYVAVLHGACSTRYFSRITDQHQARICADQWAKQYADVTPGPWPTEAVAVYAAPQASAEPARILFPAHLRKMWSGSEVQAWLDQHHGVTPPPATAKGSLARYQQWKAEQAQPGAPCSCPGAGDGSLRHPCAVHPKADKDGGQQRAEVTEAQCVAVYQALDEFGSGIDVYDFGLPGLDDHRRQKVVEIIRAALSVAQPEQGERDEG